MHALIQNTNTPTHSKHKYQLACKPTEAQLTDHTQTLPHNHTHTNGLPQLRSGTHTGYPATIPPGLTCSTCSSRPGAGETGRPVVTWSRIETHTHTHSHKFKHTGS